MRGERLTVGGRVRGRAPCVSARRWLLWKRAVRVPACDRAVFSACVHLVREYLASHAERRAKVLTVAARAALLVSEDGLQALYQAQALIVGADAESFWALLSAAMMAEVWGGK